MIHGIDVASYQNSLNVANAKDGNGIAPKIVIVKGTGGTKYTNPSCDKHYQQAKNGGKLLGFYHYGLEVGMTNKSAKDEADYFYKECKNYFGEAVPFLDMEESLNGNDSKGNRLWGQNDVDWALTWLNRVYELSGVKPVIYMSKSVTRQLDWSKVVKADYGLWVAQYGDMNWTNFTTKPWTDSQGTGAWPYAMMYQYSSTGKIQGWSAGIDFDLFYGDESSWKKYAQGSAPKPVTPVVPEVKPVQTTYYAEKGNYKALKELPVKLRSDFTGDSKQVIKVGQTFEIVAVVETKGGTSHGQTTSGGFVTLSKSYVEKIK